MIDEARSAIGLRRPRAIVAWVLQTTPALAVDVYRAIVASIALLWVGGHLFRARDLIEQAMAGRPAVAAHCESLGCAIPVSTLASVWWLGPPVGCCVLLGIHPRIGAAVLFALASATASAFASIGRPDDYGVAIILFWLILLPSGETLTLAGWLEHRRGAFARWRKVRVEGLTTRLALANLSFVYLNVGMWRASIPYVAVHRPLQVVLCLVPSLYVLPRRHPARWLASALQIAVHGWLLWATADALLNACLATSAVLFWREGLGSTNDVSEVEQENPGAPLGVSGAAGIVYLGLASLLLLGQIVHDERLTSRSAILLEHAGLLPRYLLVGEPAPVTRPTTLLERP